MNFTKQSLQFILEALGSLSHDNGYTVRGVPVAEVQQLLVKTLAARDEVDSLSKDITIEFSEHEKDIFIAAAREIMNGEHYSESDILATSGYDLQTLSAKWIEIAKSIGREL